MSSSRPACPAGRPGAAALLSSLFSPGCSEPHALYAVYPVALLALLAVLVRPARCPSSCGLLHVVHKPALLALLAALLSCLLGPAHIEHQAVQAIYAAALLALLAAPVRPALLPLTAACMLSVRSHLMSLPTLLALLIALARPACWPLSIACPLLPCTGCYFASCPQALPACTSCTGQHCRSMHHMARCANWSASLEQGISAAPLCRAWANNPWLGQPSSDAISCPAMVCCACQAGSQGGQPQPLCLPDHC